MSVNPCSFSFYPPVVLVDLCAHYTASKSFVKLITSEYSKFVNIFYYGNAETEKGPGEIAGACVAAEQAAVIGRGVGDPRRPVPRRPVPAGADRRSRPRRCSGRRAARRVPHRRHPAQNRPVRSHRRRTGLRQIRRAAHCEIDADRTRRQRPIISRLRRAR